MTTTLTLPTGQDVAEALNEGDIDFEALELMVQGGLVDALDAAEGYHKFEEGDF